MTHIPVYPNTQSCLKSPPSALLAVLECRGGPWDGDRFLWRGQSHIELEGGHYWVARRRTDHGTIVTELWWL